MLSPSKDFVVLDTVLLEKATIYRLEGNIIKIRFLDDIEIDIEDIKKLQEPKLRLTGGLNHFLLLYAPNFANVSKGAREYSASSEANIGAMGKAIIANTLAMRLIINFFITMNKPPVPHRVFNNETDALQWIEGLRRSVVMEA